jgi:KaiC/GvpD/RAD55 family RecA-like ATPase
MGIKEDNRGSMVESGVPGFDDLSYSDVGGGIPENTVTLIYGPPKTGKSIFSHQFAYHGLLNQEPCLYLLTDYGIRELKQNMMEFGWFLETHIQNDMLYVIDAISKLTGTTSIDSNTYKLSSLNDPADIMVKVGVGTRFVFKRSVLFRSVFDSLTTSFAFNPNKLVIRFYRAYINRLKEARGTVITNYTEGVASGVVENAIKSVSDNIIRLDGEYLTIERMGRLKNIQAPYRITDKGVIVFKE